MTSSAKQKKTTQKGSETPGNTGGKEKKTSKIKKGSAANQKTTNKKENRKPSSVETENRELLKKEIRFLLAIGAVILLTMCNFHGCSNVGDGVRTILRGFFGCLSYVFPFVLVGAYLFMLSNPGSKEAMLKVRLSLGLFVLFCCLVHVVGIRESDPFSLFFYFDKGQSGINGGLTGGLISGALQHLVGTKATILILVLLMLIDVILLTERSLVRTLHKNMIDLRVFLKKCYVRLEEKKAERRKTRTARKRQYEDGEETQEKETVEEEEFGKSMGEASMGGYKEEPVDGGKRSMGSSIRKKFSGPGKADFLFQKLPFWNDNGDLDGQKMDSKANWAKQTGRQKAKPESFQAGSGPWKSGSEKSGQAESGQRSDSGTGRSAAAAGRPGSGASKVCAKRTYLSLEEMGFGEYLEAENTGMDTSIDDFIVYNGLRQEYEESAPYKKASESAKDPEMSGDFQEEEDPIFAEEIVEEVEEETVETVEDEAVKETAKENAAWEENVVWEENAAGEEAVLEKEFSQSERFEKEEARDVTEHVVLPDDGPVVRNTADNMRTGRKLSGAEKASDSGIWKQSGASENRSSSGAVTFSQKPKPQAKKTVVKKPYVYPQASLLKRNTAYNSGLNRVHRETQQKLQETLQNFGVEVNMGTPSVGPTVTRYELEPEPGVKVSRIMALQDDIKLALAASDIRIEAPIPGKSAIGIEVPNRENTVVGFRELIESDKFRNHSSKVAVAVGRDISGQIIVADLAKMPHLLIAGATGSGKSVCINTLIMSILYKASPDQVKLVMVDPKVVELSIYNGIPHLLVPVVTDARKAANALHWAVDEMNDRYKKFAEYNVRNLEGYNEHLRKLKAQDPTNEEPELYQMVIIVDELADLMMVAQKEVEEAICRLAQMARAAGIHLVLATQRPSVNVITGLIKANVPSRIAFAVSSGVDSRTIIDMNGAEKLLGKGDMLFYPYGLPKPIRVQGAFISDEEVARVVEFLQKNNGGLSGQEMMEKMITSASENASMKTERDEYFENAARFIIEKDKASIGALQRNFKIGFNRAARLMDQLSAAGVVGEEDGTKPRKILMDMDEFNQFIELD